MSSILTNNGAMVALQTLKGINANLSKTQSEISTGKSVASAKDNAAIWAISKVMEADVKGFKGISDSLALGQSTVAVARKASETITELLTNMKGKIVAAQESNVDRGKIQTDVTALTEQIKSVVKAAQFNGLNLINGTGTGSIDVLASLDRDPNNAVSASKITVATSDLSTGGYVAKAAFTGSTNAAGSGDSFAFSMDAGVAGTGTIVITDPTYAAGDKISLRLGDKDVSYTVTAEDIAATSTADVVAIGLKSAIEGSGANVTVDYSSGVAGTLVLNNGVGSSALNVTGQFTNAGAGGLGLLTGLSVTTGPFAATALTNIETMINTAISAAASFGSAESRITTQATFISGLSDSLKTGIGAMVDADMEEASARLQALQTQQQLGVQALSIANQAPQSILSLFR